MPSSADLAGPAGRGLTLLDGVRWSADPVPGGRAHALLAALALAAPRSVSTGELVREVWADDAPAHPDKALQVLVSRIRAQTDAAVVARVGAGYRLGLREDQVDALRLRRLVLEAEAARSAGDLDVARHQARQALDVPLTTAADDGPYAELARRARADQGRAGRVLGAVLLARGDACEALGLLERALAEDPSDETLLAEVLRAETQERGVAAALARYAAYAQRLREELGAAPGEELRLLHAELLARDAPVRSGLKYDASPMVGRDDDVARVRSLLESSRVVSIVGAGGLGKTRMAHLVGRIAEQPVVHFVELAGVTSPEGVLPEVAAALGVRESVATVRTARWRADLRGQVVEALTGPPTLLILDNCEHLVDSVADLVAFVVAAAGSTRVLTTSRAALGIAAEQVYLLPQLDRSQAARLFGQRAQAARSDVRLDEDEVLALVDRLDGLPLAIELAAARARAMSVAEISRRLEDRFTLLTRRDPTVPDRHRTLEAVIAWSWNLLGPDEQSALAVLAAFPDGFSLEGATALLGHDALGVVMELVDQSLLVVREGDRLRYRFLETVREFGLRELQAAGGTEEVDARLRRWAVDQARRLTLRLFSREQVEAMGEIRAEAGNLAGVMRRAVEQEDAVSVVPLVGVLMSFWTIEGDHLGALAVARRVLDLVVGSPTPAPEHRGELRGVLAGLVVTLSLFTGQPADHAVRRLAELGLEGDGSRTDGLARLLLELYSDTSSPERLDVLCEDESPWVRRLALQWAAQARENYGDLEGAISCAERGLALCDDDDGPWTRALFHAQAAGLATQSGDWAAAVEHAVQAIPVMRAVGAGEDTTSLRCIVAFAEIASGRLEEAARIVEEISLVDHQATSVGWSVTSMTAEAELALARGEVETGLRRYLDALELAQQRRTAAVEMPEAMRPWLHYAQTAALVSHTRHGRREDIAWLADRVRAQIPEMLAHQGPLLDFPVLGGVVLGLGCWTLTGEPGAAARAAALRLIALGHRFGYHRSLPSLAWSQVRALVAQAGGPDGLLDELDELTERYAGVPSPGLRDALAAAVADLGAAA